jgi:hypothetical protein
MFVIELTYKAPLEAPATSWSPGGGYPGWAG